MNHSITRLTILLTVLIFAAPSFAQENPEKPGPYPVGVTTVLLVDHDRTDDQTKGPRSLMTEIWYPATDDSRGLPPNKHSDFFLRGTNPMLNAGLKAAFGVDMAAFDDVFENVAVRDARVREGEFPLIVFSHGNGGFRMQNVFWCEHMASHGYIVVSPDHTGNAAVTTINGLLVPYNNQGREVAAVDRPKDVSFLIDTMESFNKGGDSRFTGKIDIEHIGVAGHSFGGYTATVAADQDERIDAIAPMAGVGRERSNYEVPALILMATEDDTIKAEGNERVREYFEQSKGPHYLVEFEDGGHYSFTEMFQYKADFGDGVGSGKRITSDEPLDYTPKAEVYRLTNGYTTAFFGHYLKGESQFDEYLTVNQAPDTIIFKTN